MQKVLEDANIKLASVASDVMGVSARAMLDQIVQGQTDAALLAELAKGRLRDKQDLLLKALSGRVRPHHRFMLAQHLSHIDFLDEAIDQLDQQIQEQMRPFAAALATWDSLPGINQRIAEIIVAEIGADLEPFEDADHLASWAGMCPGNNESAGKRKSGRTRKGSPWLRRALIEAAHGAAHTKHKYFQALYRRLAARRGKQRAAVAVGHSLLVTGYYLITRQTKYEDLGGNYFDERDREAVKRRAVKRLEKLGYQVQRLAGRHPDRVIRTIFKGVHHEEKQGSCEATQRRVCAGSARRVTSCRSTSATWPITSTMGSGSIRSTELWTSERRRPLLPPVASTTLTAWVRPKTMQRSEAYHYLEDGAMGFMIPFVSTVEIAARCRQCDEVSAAGQSWCGWCWP